MVKIGHYEVRQELLYYDNYIWLERLSDTEMLIGITDYAQQSLKDITSIMPPASGQRFISGSELFSIESIAREFMIKSPVSCVIQEVNSRVVNSPDILNDKPFDNWILRVEVLDHGDLDQLISSEDMADNILDEVSLEKRSVNSDEDPLSDDFDYESEFSIDSGSSYDFYEDDTSSYDDEYDW